jgi:HPt (histidine-containing phosphotransfer) domain-containing protein
MVTEDPKPARDGDFLDTMLDRFLAEIPDVVKRLSRAVECQDPAELGRIGHRLRGASDILEIRKLSNLSRALEQAGKNGESAEAERLATELIDELQKMAAALQYPAN